MVVMLYSLPFKKIQRNQKSECVCDTLTSIRILSNELDC